MLAIRGLERLDLNHQAGRRGDGQIRLLAIWAEVCEAVDKENGEVRT